MFTTNFWKSQKLYRDIPLKQSDLYMILLFGITHKIMLQIIAVLTISQRFIFDTMTNFVRMKHVHYKQV